MKHTVHEHKLAGGAQGLVIDVPGSAVVNIQVRYNSGFQFADRKVFEVPHVMEHLLATVTKRYPSPNQFNIEVKKNGAYTNAFTSSSANFYVYECADFESDRILDLIQEQVSDPLLTAKPLKAELSNVREELSRNTTDHGRVCMIRLDQAAFPHLAMDYDERIAQLPRITVPKVQEHYRRTHTAANARFYVAGSFADGGERIANRLDQVFRRLDKGERLMCSRDIGLRPSDPITTERDIEQVYYQMMLYFGEMTESERLAFLLLRVVLAGSFGSRVLGEARARGLAYHVSCLGHAQLGNSSVGFGGYVTPDHARALFELSAREFAAVRAGAVGESELDAAKDLIIGQVKRSTQTPADLLGWYIDCYDEKAEIRDFDKTLEKVRAVRPAEVAAVADKAAAAGRPGISLVGPVNEQLAQEYAGIWEPMWQKNS